MTTRTRTRISRCISAQALASMSHDMMTRHGGNVAWFEMWSGHAAQHAYRAQLMLTMLVHECGAAEAAIMLRHDIV